MYVTIQPLNCIEILSVFQSKKGLTSNGNLDADIKQNEERKEVNRIRLQYLSE